ncbi:MAG: tetratricopeptide repeat protein [Saprospiraceae bacterium]|nr:tetratricopeptide repeat protein [Saprospiraceae bacterium]
MKSLSWISMNRLVIHIIYIAFLFFLSVIETGALCQSPAERISKVLNKQHSNLDSLIINGESDLKVMRAHKRLAWTYLNQLGNITEAEKYNTKADSMAYAMGDTSAMAETKTIQGRINFRKGYFSSALADHQRALDLKVALKDTGRMAYSMRLIGMVFEAQKKYDKALEFYNEGMELREAKGDAEGATLFFMNMAQCHLELDNVEKARIYANKAVTNTRDSTRQAAKCITMLGRIDMKTGNYDRALNKLKRAESYMLLKGPEIELAEIKGYVAKALMLTSDFNKAEIKAKESYELAKRNNHPEFIIRALTSLKEIAFKKKDLERAYEIAEEIKIRQDSFYKREEMLKSLDFESLYKAKEKENTIVQLESERRALESQIQVRNREKRMMFLIIILLIISLAGIVGFYLFKRSKEKQLEQRDDIIQNQKAQQIIHERKSIRMQSLIEGQEQERTRISRDIHDGLGGLLSATKAQLLNPDNNTNKVHELIDQACEEVREITQNLMPVSLKTVGLKGAIEDLIRKTECLPIKIKSEISIEEKYDEHIALNVYRVIQELINNVVKHAKAKNLLVQVLHADEEVKILIEDDGVGYNALIQNGGMGIKNVNARVELLNGDINIDTAENIGTTVNIDIPVIGKNNTAL